MRLGLFLIVALSAHAEDAKPAEAKPAEPRKESKLAPVVKYLDVWLHLHSKDAGKPKVILLLDAGDEAPSWYSTAAMHYKTGREKKVGFMAIKAGKDAQTTASRFGVAEIPEGGVLFGCTIDGAGGGHFKRYTEPLAEGGAGARSRGVRAFVDGLLSGIPEDERSPLPAFPEPTRPRKAAPVSLEEFTHESLPLRCYGVQAKPLCVLAVMPTFAGEGCPAEVAALAKRHANDPVGFGCVGARKQDTFLAAYGIDAAELPVMIAVKAGKRPRFAKLNDNLDSQAMNLFVDTILGGGASFKRIEELPELEAPYLLDKDEV
eukprot:CAMPEP_0115866902 /NCGR_PEP_ID=MMETSP0287-20121206/20490_1 /TAXON_ID=412157 /ORGANISM="Chrysochromulina rotalis, Strain UIO044" /LENGTH=317 /DNA_ID=CAMNT_0003321487 /DNA_START=16 /DNA_END=969 /DNA_ORIENTATION=+